MLPDRVVDGSLLVENEKIVGILEPEIQTHIENCEIVDVTGKTLLPGLIDTHVHMWDPSPQLSGRLVPWDKMCCFWRDYYSGRYAIKRSSCDR